MARTEELGAALEAIGWKRERHMPWALWESPDGSSRVEAYTHAYNAQRRCWRVTARRRVEEPDGDVVWPLRVTFDAASAQQAVNVLVAAGVLCMPADGRAEA